MTQSLFPELQAVVDAISFDSLSTERKVILHPLVHFLQQKIEGNQVIKLNFICTHNSRRSHLSQVWAQALGHYFGIHNLQCFSGGTEATAVFPMVVETLENSAFKVDKLSEGRNPVYAFAYAESEPAVIAFSKAYDHSFNPKKDFAAILTCSEADDACPNIVGAEARFPIPYEDPKAFDNSPLQQEKYRERSTQIATELTYVFAQLKL